MKDTICVWCDTIPARDNGITCSPQCYNAYMIWYQAMFTDPDGYLRIGLREPPPPDYHDEGWYIDEAGLDEDTV